MNVFSINSIAATILGYPLSWPELIGTVFGLWCVWLVAREKVLSWPVSLVNVVFFALVFYQVCLYSDLFLQSYFFATGVYGWWKWTHPATGEARWDHALKVTSNGLARNLVMLAAIVVLSVAAGAFMGRIHTLMPTLFPRPAAFPYWDSAVMVMSVFAQWLLTRKKIENWVLWLAVDTIAVVLYWLKGIKLMSLEYVVFFAISSYGLWSWSASFRADRGGKAPAPADS